MGFSSFRCPGIMCLSVILTFLWNASRVVCVRPADEDKVGASLEHDNQVQHDVSSVELGPHHLLLTHNLSSLAELGSNRTGHSGNEKTPGRLSALLPSRGAKRKQLERTPKSGETLPGRGETGATSGGPPPGGPPPPNSGGPEGEPQPVAAASTPLDVGPDVGDGGSAKQSADAALIAQSNGAVLEAVDGAKQHTPEDETLTEPDEGRVPTGSGPEDGTPPPDDGLSRDGRAEVNAPIVEPDQLEDPLHVPEGPALSHAQMLKSSAAEDDRWNHFQEFLKHKPAVDAAVDKYRTGIEKVKEETHKVDSALDVAVDRASRLHYEMKGVNREFSNADRAVHLETRRAGANTVKGFHEFNTHGAYGHDEETGKEWVPNVGQWDQFKGFLEEAQNKMMGI